MNETNPPTNQPTPYAAAPKPAEPTMSMAETLTGIFFEPGRTFESLRARPRFLVVMLIIIALTTVFSFLFIQRIGYENIVRAQVENSPRLADMDPAQKEQIIQAQSGPIAKTLGLVAPIIVIAVMFAAGAGLYLLGTMMMASAMSYKQALSVWAYSSFPPTVLLMLANILLLFLKSPDDIDVTRARSGMVHANPSLVMDATAHPVLATALGAIDLFAIFGLFLAALGLRKVARISAGAAWGIVIAIWLIGVVIRIAFAAMFGTPMA